VCETKWFISFALILNNLWASFALFLGRGRPCAWAAPVPALSPTGPILLPTPQRISAQKRAMVLLLSETAISLAIEKARESGPRALLSILPIQRK
jgi:hypothetical protein